MATMSPAGHAESGLAEDRRDWAAFVTKSALVYCAVSLATLPFMNAVWLGELPLLAVPQVPKVALANWLRSDVLIPAAGQLGLSRGSWSPDWSLTRPYALALAYLLVLGLLAAIAAVTRPSRPAGRPVGRAWQGLLLVAFLVDYSATLSFADGPILRVY
jgi:hypothetical protein